MSPGKINGKKWGALGDLVITDRNVVVISLTLFIMVAAYFSWYLLLPIYLRQLGADNFQVGLSYTLLTISYAAMQLVGGLLADRIGRKPLIVWPTFAAALLYYLVGMSRSWQVLVALLLVLNSVAALQWPAFLSMMAESVSPRQRGAAFSLMELFVVLGITVGPAAGAALLPHIAFSGLMIITALLTLPCAIIRALLLRETKPEPSRGESRWKRRLFQGHHGSFLMAAIFFALALTLTIYGPFIALYANDIIGLGETQINLMFAMGGLAAVALSLVGGRIIDRSGSGKILKLCLLIFPLILIVWTWTGSYLWSASVYVLAYLLCHAANISYQIQLTSVGPAELRSSMVGIFGSISGMISAAGPVLGSFLAARLGAATPFYGAMVCAVVAALFFGRSRRDRWAGDNGI